MSEKIFVIDKDRVYEDVGRATVTFHAFYRGKKKKWQVGKHLYQLLLELEKLQPNPHPKESER